MQSKSSAVYQVEKKGIKLAVFSRNNAFLGDLIEHFHRDYTCRVFTGLNINEMYKLMNGAILPGSSGAMNY